MKKITFFGLFVLLGVLFSPLLAKADVVMPNFHQVGGCAKIVNLDKFTDVVLIGYITGPMVSKYEAYQIKNNECLTRGYKFNSLSVYWTTKEKFKIIDLKNLNIKTEKVKSGGHDQNGNIIYYNKLTPADLSFLIDKMETGENYVEDSNPLIRNTEEYNVIKSIDGKYSLNKSKVTSEYNNGTPNKIETFGIENPQKAVIDIKKIVEGGIQKVDVGVQEVKKVQKRGFWGSVWCFIGLTKYCD